MIIYQLPGSKSYNKNNSYLVLNNSNNKNSTIEGGHPFKLGLHRLSTYMKFKPPAESIRSSGNDTYYTSNNNIYTR